MTLPIDVVIVGGGTAGWMCAAALTGVAGRLCNVTLIESDDIGTVGVGEATLPQIKDFNDFVGIPELEMMQQTNATFKLGIEFVDWGSKGASYIHPFGTFGTAGGVDFHQHWVRASNADLTGKIEDYSFAIQACRKNRFEFPSDNKADVASTFTYAYHFDAMLYAKYLRKFSEAKGLKRIEGKISEAKLNISSGAIQSVRLENGTTVSGDYFIDCSGFRSLLLGQTLKAKFEGWNQWLPCDRAVAVPCASQGELMPYTRATAKPAGWQWRIPLQNRTGNGLVYCSDLLSDDEACSNLLGSIDGEALAEPNQLKFKTGRYKKSWDSNCIAIGLAGGFLEPLESTSIYLIQQGVLNFLKLLPRKQNCTSLRNEYNRLMDIEYERIRDFLILHYHLNERNDSDLWRNCRNMEIPESLDNKIKLFQHRGFIETYKYGLFAPASWISVYLGQGLKPENVNPYVSQIPVELLEGRFNDLSFQINDKVNQMSSHGDFIRQYCPSKV